jgi:hypothetical protein
MKIIFKGGRFDGREDRTAETDAFLTRDGFRYGDGGETDHAGRRIFVYEPRENDQGVEDTILVVD